MLFYMIDLPRLFILVIHMSEKLRITQISFFIRCNLRRPYKLKCEGNVSVQILAIMEVFIGNVSITRNPGLIF